MPATTAWPDTALSLTSWSDGRTLAAGWSMGNREEADLCATSSALDGSDIRRDSDRLTRPVPVKQA